MDRSTLSRVVFQVGFWAVTLFTGTPTEAQNRIPEPSNTSPNVLVINSYAPGYIWSDEVLEGVLSELRTVDNEIKPVIQFLDFKSFPNPNREQWLIQDLSEKCRIRPPKLIITIDNAAFDFALKYREQLGAEVPLVFGGINRFVPEMIAGHRNITGVSEETDYSGTFRLIEHLRPAADKILVISNRLPSAIESRKVFESFLPRYSDRYTFEIWDDWTNEELFARLEHLNDDWVVLILDVVSDVNGTENYSNAEFSRALASRPRVPVFINARPPGARDTALDPWECIGGGLVSAEVHGKAIGRMGARILQGEDINANPVIPHSPQRIEVEYSQMKRFGIPLKQLPPEAHVLNAPVTFYQINRSRMLLAGAVFIILLLIIALLSVNILARKRAEKALRKAEEHLRTSQKLEAVGLLAGGVAHDFNNILQVISGHGHFLQEALKENSEAINDVEIIQEATARAAQLTRQLLAFSRQQPLKPASVEMNGLVSDMARMLSRVLGEHIELKIIPLKKPCTISADKGQLEQVLLNLCINARDAMPDGGRILIELNQVHLDNAAVRELPEIPAGSYLKLSVSDSGCGIPPDLLKQVFDPFFTTKDQGKGTGMGLAVVYGVIHQHQGSIRVYSEAGKGTVFRIFLPSAPASGHISETESTASFPRGSGKILLAEDEDRVRKLTVRILESNGFEVVVAKDGNEALSMLQKHHGSIRMAIIDVIMPKRSGKQVFDIMQQKWPDIPVLFCSGYSAEMLPTENMPDAGISLLNKPYSRTDLLSHVHRILEEANTKF